MTDTKDRLRSYQCALCHPSSVIRHLSESASRVDPARMQHLVELAVILRKAGAVGFGMPQMQDAGCEPAILAAHAGPDEADEKVGVLPAPTAERRVEPVHLFQVCSPERHVAATPATPAPANQLARSAKRQVEQRREAVELTARARRQPARKSPHFGFKPLLKDTVSQARRQQNARAGDEPPPLRKMPMRSDEAR